jgi:uncharacterized protein (TIGR00251 family)
VSNGESGLKIDETPGGIAIWIHVTPRSKHPHVGGLHGEALRVAVAEPPLEGKANAACRKALSAALDCSRAEVEIDPAARSRRKRVHIRGSRGPLKAQLASLADPARLR